MAVVNLVALVWSAAIGAGFGAFGHAVATRRRTAALDDREAAFESMAMRSYAVPTKPKPVGTSEVKPREDTDHWPVPAPKVRSHRDRVAELATGLRDRVRRKDDTAEYMALVPTQRAAPAATPKPIPARALIAALQAARAAEENELENAR